MIYIFISLYTVICSFIYSKRAKSISNKFTTTKLKNIIIFIIMILPCILVAGLRYGISVDYTKIYVRGFNIITNNYGNPEFEIGFTYLIKLCGSIVNKPWFMFLTVSCITILIYFCSFRNSANYIISTILFFGAGVYFDSFNGIRQYIVCAIFLYCFKYIKNNDWKKYFIIMGLCMFIHMSAFFTLPLYFLKKININKIHCIIIACCLMLFHNQLYNLILNIISSIPKYNEYIVKNTLSAQISLSTSGIIMAIIALLPCIIAEQRMVENEDGKFLYNMMMIGLIIAISTSFLPFAERMLYYSRTYILLAVPYACNLIKGKKKTIYEICTLSLMCGMNFIGIFFMDWYAILPYVSIFNQ